MAYENHIASLERKLNAMQEVTAMYQAKTDKAQREVFALEASIRKFTRKQEVDAKIEALDVPHRVITLAQLTIDRANEVKRMRNGNRGIRSAYFRLANLVNNGDLPKFGHDASRVHRGLRVIGWIDTILCQDMSTKSINLRSSVDAEANSLLERNKEDAA